MFYIEKYLLICYNKISKNWSVAIMENNKSPNSQIKKRIEYKKRKKRLAKRFFLFFIILYISLLLIFLLIFSLTLKSCKENEKKHDIAIITTEKTTETIKKEDLYFNNELYIPISVIERLTGIKLTGDKNEISFIIEENEEFAKFKIDTRDAIINGNLIELSSNSKIINNELYLPFDFFKSNMLGLNIMEEKNGSTYTISVQDGKKLEFILKTPTQTPPISEFENESQTEAPLNFILDLSSYEEYMNPKNRDEYLILVNTDNHLDENFAPTDLTGSIFTRNDRDTRTLRKYACLALEAFLKEAGANGMKNITVTSAYRSYQYQNELFQNEVSILGSEEAAAKNVNPPGSSEHQTGLAVDMHNMSAASKEFGKTAEAKWLASNAHKFGYILRYPADKTDITGISYEPWHFRYVGRYHATKMYELDMCLEEYIEYINH